MQLAKEELFLRLGFAKHTYVDKLIVNVDEWLLQAKVAGRTVLIVVGGELAGARRHALPLRIAELTTSAATGQIEALYVLIVGGGGDHLRVRVPPQERTEQLFQPVARAAVSAEHGRQLAVLQVVFERALLRRQLQLAVSSVQSD